MYVPHPIHDDFYSWDDFVEKNIDTIRSLWEQSKGIIPDSSNSQQSMEQRACVISMAVFHNLTTFEGIDIHEYDFDDEDETAMFEFFNQIFTLISFFMLHDQGVIDMDDDNQIRFTNFGQKHVKRLVSKKKALGHIPDGLIE